jgi:hypothetical protein
MRSVLCVTVLVLLAGCTGVDVPCAPWDDDCATAALFAEQTNDGWDASAVAEVTCAEALAMRGFQDPDRCWRVRLDAAGDPPQSTEVHVVRTTDGELVMIGNEDLVGD